MARFLRAERGFLQRLHHQSLSVNGRLDGRRANRVAMGLRRRVRCRHQDVRCCGGCGYRGEGPGTVEQELGERDGGRRGGRGGSGGRVGFEVGGLWVGGDLDVGRVRLVWLGWGLGGRLVGGLDQRVGG